MFQSDMILVGNEHLKMPMQDKNIPINIEESRQRKSKSYTNLVKYCYIHTYTHSLSSVQLSWTTLMALFNEQQKQQQHEQR